MHSRSEIKAIHLVSSCAKHKRPHSHLKRHMRCAARRRRWRGVVYSSG